MTERIERGFEEIQIPHEATNHDPEWMAELDELAEQVGRVAEMSREYDPVVSEGYEGLRRNMIKRFGDDYAGGDVVSEGDFRGIVASVFHRSYEYYRDAYTSRPERSYKSNGESRFYYERGVYEILTPREIRSLIGKYGLLGEVKSAKEMAKEEGVGGLQSVLRDGVQRLHYYFRYREEARE